MKTKKMTPATVAPVKRENTATVSLDGSAIAPLRAGGGRGIPRGLPFSGDDAQ